MQKLHRVCCLPKNVFLIRVKCPFIVHSPAVQLHQIVPLVVNCITIISLIRNHTMGKCFLLYEKQNFDFTTMFCDPTSSFYALILNVWSFEQRVETCTFTKTQFFAKVFLAKYFTVEIQKQGKDFSTNFHCYSLLLLSLL